MSEFRTYSELIKIPDFTGRFEYLKLDGQPFDNTFGGSRYLNQQFYISDEWTRLRHEIIIRDNGCDLGIEGEDIYGKIYVHHIMPITKDDIMFKTKNLLDPENLICMSYDTHQAVHYGNADMVRREFIERFPNDTCPWKRR